MTSVFHTPSDSLAPGDVREIKRLDGLARLQDGVQLMHYDWTVAGTPLPNAPTSLLGNFIPPIQDATVVATPGVGLQLNPAPQAYVQTVDQAGNLNAPPTALGPTGGFFDLVKFLTFAPKTGFPPPPTVGFAAPTDGRELYFTAVVAGCQTYPAAPKFPAAFLADVENLPRDLRLAVPALCVVDPASYLFFDVLITNSTFYAGYGRRPFLKPSWGGPGPDYQGFEAHVPIGQRNSADPLNDFATIQMAYNKKAGTIRWIIDGQEVYRVSRLGFPLESRYMDANFGGPPAPVSPSVLKFGPALYAPLDHTRPLDPGVDIGDPANQSLVAQVPVALHFSPLYVVTGNGATAGDPIPFVNADFADPASLLANRLFGQGSQMVLKVLDVTAL